MRLGARISGGRLRRRAGSVYVLVLGASMLVTVIGVGSVLALRAQSRAIDADIAFAQARLNAQAAVEWGRFTAAPDTDWRTRLPHGDWLVDKPLGRGSCSLRVVDVADGSLADALGQSVRMTGTGAYGPARYLLQVDLQPVLSPIESLRSALHAGGTLQVKGGKTLTLTNGPTTAAGALILDGDVYGSTEAASRSGGGFASVVPTIPGTFRHLPDARVFAMYRSVATPISISGDIDRKVLTPTLNPWGAANASGVYYLDTGGRDIAIKKSRIEGTLVIKATGKTVTIDDRSLLYPARSDYPVLIVDGNLEIKLKSATERLEESSAINMNPANAPWNGVTDNDTSDEYASLVYGLVHVLGNAKLADTTYLRGGLICHGNVVIDGAVSITLNRAYTERCWGYVWESRYEPVAGSWTQAVLP